MLWQKDEVCLSIYVGLISINNSLKMYITDFKVTVTIEPLNGRLGLSFSACLEKTGPTCIESCAGLPDGHYQSCEYCGCYHSCVNQAMYVNRPCAELYLEWDDNLKKCEWSSPTCNCVTEK